MTAAFALGALLEEARLEHAPAPGGGFEVPVGGGRRTRQVLEVAELQDGVLRVLAPLPDPASRFGKPRGARFVHEQLLRVGYLVPFAKGIAREPGGLAVAADLPAALLDGALARSLILAVACLADVPRRDLPRESGWESARVRFGQTLDAPGRRSPGEVLEEATGVLRSAGLEPERTREDTIMVSVDASSYLTAFVHPLGDGVSIEAMTDYQIRATVRPDPYPQRLLAANREAAVAKLGTDGVGDVILHYQVPRLLPELLEQAWAGIAALNDAVVALDN